MSTELEIVNGTDEDVTVWITLGATPGCLQDVSKIPFITDVLSPLVGSFVLPAKSSVGPYAPSNLGFNGNVSFNAQPLNCPNEQFPDGVNLFEFVLNNSFQSGIPQETVDISCVAGANCFIRGELSGKTWNAGPTEPSVTKIENGELYDNTGRVGVYPFLCDDCTASVAPPACPTPKAPATPQANAICNVQRDAKNAGGLVKVTYLGCGVPA